MTIDAFVFKVEDIAGRLVRDGPKMAGLPHFIFARRQKAWIDRMLWEQQYIFRFEAAP